MKQVQYTVRGVPEKIDQALRKKARQESKSLNTAMVEALEKGLGVSHAPIRYTDLDDLAGTWVADPEFDRALTAMDRVDEELWE